MIHIREASSPAAAESRELILNHATGLARNFTAVLRNLCFHEVTEDDDERRLASLNRRRLSNAHCSGSGGVG